MTWTAPEVDREQPPNVADERGMLAGWLDFHRQTLRGKCAGLTADQLRLASVEPSGLTLLGLVRHMSTVERFWFREMATGQQLPEIYLTDEDPDADFNALAEADAATDLGIFADECAASDAAVADLALEHVFTSRRGKELSLRWVYLHMIEEYARHNGHADLLRERIDGVTGD
jgi:uncharacterized damage-inducible protein DinB